MTSRMKHFKLSLQLTQTMHAFHSQSLHDWTLPSRRTQFLEPISFTFKKWTLMHWEKETHSLIIRSAMLLNGGLWTKHLVMMLLSITIYRDSVPWSHYIWHATFPLHGAMDIWVYRTNNYIIQRNQWIATDPNYVVIISDLIFLMHWVSKLKCFGKSALHYVLFFYDFNWHQIKPTILFNI